MPEPGTPTVNLEKLLFSRREVAQVTGLSLPFIDALVKKGELRVIRIGARTLVPREELLRFSGVIRLRGESCL